MSKDFHVVIPARYGSARLPGKPLIDIAGVPMVLRVADNATQSGAQSVVVATDDVRVIDVCRAAGVDALLTSADHQSGSDRVYEVATRKNWAGNEVVVNVQGDEPLLHSGVIRRVGLALHEDESVNVCTLRDPIENAADLRDENIVKVLTDRFDRALYFSRAAIPHTRLDNRYDRAADQGNYGWRHVGIYAFRVKQLADFVGLPHSVLETQEMLEQLRLLEDGVAIKVLASKESVPGGVDTPEDLERVRSQFSR